MVKAATPVRSRLRARHLLPLFVLAGVAVTALLTSSAFGSSAPSAGDPDGQALRATTPPITYSTPTSKALIFEGQQLFEVHCSSCHAPDASGTGVAPDLQGLGAGTVDFWVSTGRMPLETAAAEAVRKPPLFDARQTEAIAAFVSSLAPDYGIGIPHVDTKTADVATGQSMFVLNCAACHTITGSGDALANGAKAPSLHQATITQAAEAIRTGPGNMPRFGPGTLSDQQVADIVAYVTGYLQHPRDDGGIGLGGIGPVAEGFVALLVGVGGIMLIAFWLGERS